MKALILSAETAVEAPSGVRTSELREAFLAAGCEVSVVLRSAERCNGDNLCWDRWNLLELIRRISPDAVILPPEAWEPTEQDYGSLLLLDLGGRGTFPVSCRRRRGRRFLQSLHAADAVLVSTREEYLYYCGWAVQAGRFPDAAPFVLIAGHQGRVEALKKLLAEKQTAQRSSPALGSVAPRIASLDPCRRSAALRLTARNPEAAVSLRLPSDDIAGVECRLGPALGNSVGKAVVSLLDSRGRVLCRRDFRREDLSRSAPVYLPSGKWDLVRGGAQYSVVARAEFSSSGAGEVEALGFSAPVFPFCALRDRATSGVLYLRVCSGPQAGLKSFMLRAGKALRLLREGDYLRVWSAVRRRLPKW